MTAPGISPTDSRTPVIAQHARTYAATGGQQGQLWNGAPTLLLTTTGRKTGLPRRTPLIYGRHHGGYLVVASNAGANDHPDWYLNLLQNPPVTIQVVDQVIEARARPVAGVERLTCWAIMTARWPDYDSYQSRISRVIPVIFLEPVTPEHPAATSEGDRP
ncbi:nitroreductase family deazaflavin-dependent oxidoreductase [Actinoplanes sp. G11-F43]|uniref:nitroreductase family deazaflavin-dependent oxidoreductase n=1 Tax=Actinoplanes sp. G11-F43 TaxID=3424130 RepID=UPI003D34A8D1